MKKYIIIAAAAIAAMACSKVNITDNTPDVKLTFAPAAYAPQTKAEALQDSEDAIEEFKSYAVFHPNGGDGVAFFTPTGGVETISLTEGTPNVWAPSHDYYWPKAANSYINFISWYDENGTPNTHTETSLSWVIDGSTRSLATDDNILFADEAWRYTRNDTSTDDPNYISVSGVAGGVPTLFHHALGKVKFTVRAAKLNNGVASPNTTSWEITLTTFSLSNVFSTGKLDLINADPEDMTTSVWKTKNGSTAYASCADAAWVTTGTAAALTKDSSNDVSITSTDAANPQTIIAQRSVIPQSISNMTLTVTCTVVTKFNGTAYMTEEISQDIALSEILSTAWSMNKILTYNIVINPETSKVLYDPALEEDWTSADGSATVPAQS